jgi:outer membrane protein
MARKGQYEMKQSVLIVASLLLLCPLSGWAQESVVMAGETMTLAKCIEIALHHNPDVRFYQASAEARQSSYRQAKKEYYPRIDLKGSYTRYNKIFQRVDDPYTSVTPDRNSYDAGVTLSQTIYDFGKREAAVASSRFTFESSLMDMDDNTRVLLGTIREAYYDLLKTKRELAVNAEKVEKYQRHYEQANLFYQTGTKARYDVTKAEVDLGNARLELLQSDNDLKMAVETLNNAMGIFDAPAYEIEDNFSDRTGSIPLEAALPQAYQNRPDLQALMKQLAAAEKTLEAAKQEYYPSVAGSAGYSANGGDFALSSGWNVGVTVSVPVFEGFLTRYKVLEKEAEIRKLKSKIDSLKLQVNMDVRKAYLNLGKAEKSIANTELQVRQATENMELADLKYSTGLNSPLEVTDATVSYGDAKLKHIKALYEYKKAEANIEKAIGKR